MAAKMPTSLTDVIQFFERHSDGSARVQFPRIDSCPTCGGMASLDVATGNGTVRVDNPELAQQIALIQQGYNLAVNEMRAARGMFRRHDPADGGPDSWQFIEEIQLCTCGAEAANADQKEIAA
jgi:hypothetical protein